jgi:hypothetical protein
VFHHRYCRQVVETWGDEFCSANCEKRVSLLYLANDIMQNSRKEGNGYIAEFMRVIPAALNEVFTNGDDFGRNVVKRLVGEHNIDIYMQGLLTLRFMVLVSPLNKFADGSFVIIAIYSLGKYCYFVKI